jgi:hypothetical protein
MTGRTGRSLNVMSYGEIGERLHPHAPQAGQAGAGESTVSTSISKRWPQLKA